jgi:hypothetical protein
MRGKNWSRIFCGVDSAQVWPIFWHYFLPSWVFKVRRKRISELTLSFEARILVQHVYVCYLMKANITLKLDAALLREIRILAAEEGTSISAMLAARLEQIVRERKSYDRSRRRALARLRDGMNLGWTPPRSRDELHER